MEFRSVYDQGFARIAAVTAPVAPANPAKNAQTTIDLLQEAQAQGVAVAVFPELNLTGYAIDDLFLQEVLLEQTLAAIESVRQASAELTVMAVVGAPLRQGNRLYNCALAIQGGRVYAVAPKTFLPNYREFYEKRHFASGAMAAATSITLPGVGDGPTASAAAQVSPSGAVVPFGNKLLLDFPHIPGMVLHMEVCEDLWVPVAPSAQAALAGANVLVNLSGSPITVGRADDRELLARSASLRCNAAYVYAAAGEGESSTDLSWDGQTMIYELGEKLAETERFPQGPRMAVADVDIRTLASERLRQGSFDDNRVEQQGTASDYRTISVPLVPTRADIGLRRPLDRFPFVPDDPARLAQDCYEAYSIQVAGLEQRLRAIGNPKLVIGVSGGLDSTHALIVAARAMDRLGRPRSDIIAITMPGFATTAGTKRNAIDLATRLGCTFEEIDIRPVATQMLKDMGHPFGRGEEVYDVTFENVQAGLRTDFLFRIANERGGIVLGTGDLSELALGWCTFGVGDQMAHYGVNAGIPKTLIQHLIRWVVAEKIFDDAVGATLLSVLDTEISPELVPSKEGEPIQSTQAKIGPYPLQDFTLFQVLRRGARPSRIAFLAEKAWHDASTGHWPVGIPESEQVAYQLPEIRKWLELFIKRFFANQFKRSTLPNGPKVVAGGTLSPRGDWRMPSDASGAAWLSELERNVPKK
ncbi:MAG: NAD(+) synthase [Actinomyces graevenitzii]|nr:NAD(+) synthase [Actinomyces graevenitzii]